MTNTSVGSSQCGAHYTPESSAGDHCFLECREKEKERKGSMTVYPGFLRPKWAMIMSRGSPSGDKKNVSHIENGIKKKRDLSHLLLVSPDDIPIRALGQEKVKADCLLLIPRKGIVAKLYNNNSPLHSLITWFLICPHPLLPRQCLPAAPPRRPDPSAELESGCLSPCGSQAEGFLLQESPGRSSVREIESLPRAAG